MCGYWRLCNHCGTDIPAATTWVYHMAAVAKAFGHRDDLWLREAAGRERALVGEVEYAHILSVTALRDSCPARQAPRAV